MAVISLTLSLVYLLVFFLTIYYLQLVIYQLVVEKKTKLRFFPGIKWPFFGHIYWLLRKSSNVSSCYKENIIHKLCQEFKTPIAGWYFDKLFVIVHSAEDVEVVYNKCISRGFGYSYFKHVLGNGITLLPGKKWKPLRKAVSPAFTQKILDSFVDKYAENSDLLIDILGKENGYKNVNMFAYIVDLTSTIIFETIMGIDSNYSKEEAVSYGKMLQTVVNDCFERIRNPYYLLDFVYAFSSVKSKHENNAKLLRNSIKNIVKERKKEANEDNLHYLSNDKNQSVFLQHLLDLSKKGILYDDKLIEDDSNGMMFGGVHTTATTIYFTLLLIAMHEDVQTKIFNEILEVIGPSRNIEYTDLPNLTYLDCVIKETLRLFPPGPTGFRKSEEEDVILPGGQVIPKNTLVIINVRSLHLDERYFPDAFKFNPDRFLPVECVKRHPYSFSPFGMGQRNCIGKKMALMMVTTIIASLIRKFHFHTKCKCIEDVKDLQDVFLQPEDGTQLEYSLR